MTARSLPPPDGPQDGPQDGPVAPLADSHATVLDLPRQDWVRSDDTPVEASPHCPVPAESPTVSSVPPVPAVPVGAVGLAHPSDRPPEIFLARDLERQAADARGAGTIPPLSSEAVTLQVEPSIALLAASAEVAASTAPRTTVLPRVEHTGGLPRMVTAMRSRFETETVLGRGAFGEVILARDNDIDRRVAIKHLLREASDPGTVARFAEEVRTLGRLDHPNIVALHDVGLDDDGRYFYVMKFVEGETLEAIIDKLASGDVAYHRLYTFDRRVQVFLGMLRAIQYAHAQGVLHRDIKPANVMVGRYGEVAIMDWGVSRPLDAPPLAPPPSEGSWGSAWDAGPTEADPLRTVAGALIGTPWYMSPEQARGRALDERSDVYALCVVFHELLGLRHYLADRTAVNSVLDGVVHCEAPFVSEVLHPSQPVVPREYAHFIRHGLSKDPAGRFRSVTSMIDRVESIRDGRIPVECTVTMVKRVGNEGIKMVDQHPAVMILTAVAMLSVGLLGAGALIWLLLNR